MGIFGAGPGQFPTGSTGFSALGFAARFRKICKNKTLRLLGMPPKLIFFLSFLMCCLISSVKTKCFFQMCSVDFPVITSIASTKSQMAARQALPETGGLLYTSAARCDCRRNFWSQLGRRVAPISNGLSSFSQFCMVIWWYTLLSNTPGF